MIESAKGQGPRNAHQHEPQTISLGELFELDIPKREHLITPWMRQGESVMVYAAPGVGKTLFAMSLALAVAGGGILLNTWQAGTPRKVLYIDGEMPMDDIKERARLLLPSAGGSSEAASGNLHIMARQHQAADAWFIDLAQEASQRHIIEQATRDGIELVILDNLSTLATIEDENAASAFNDTIKFLLKMKQAGIACLLVHHAGKASASYRGSSKIATTFEAIIQLTQASSREDDACDTTRFVLSWEKYRGRRDESTGHKLEVSLAKPAADDTTKMNEAAGTYAWHCAPPTDERLEIVLELLKSGEHATNKSIARAVGMTEVEMTRMKNTAIKQGIISGADWKRYLSNAKRERGKQTTTAESLEVQDF